MSLVIDASVAIKWFVREVQHSEASDILRGGDALHAPDLLAVEVANIARKKALRGDISEDQARQIAGSAFGEALTLHPSVELLAPATVLALRHRHTVHDSLYVACAEALDAPLVTADRKLWRSFAAGRHGVRSCLLGLPDSYREWISLSPRQVAQAVGLAQRMAATNRNIHEAHRSGRADEGILSSPYDPDVHSAPYQMMRSFLAALSGGQRADLLALSWLGFGTEGTDWTALRARAATWTKAHTDDLALTCIAAKSHHVPRGFETFATLLEVHIDQRLAGHRP